MSRGTLNKTKEPLEEPHRHIGKSIYSHTILDYILHDISISVQWMWWITNAGAQDLLKQRDSVSHSGFLRKRGKLERIVGSNGLFTAIFSELSKCMLKFTGQLVDIHFLVYYFKHQKMDTKMICIYKLHFSWLCLFVGQGVSASWLSVEGVCMCTPTSMADPLSRLSLSEATAGKTDPYAGEDPNIFKKREWIHVKINYKNPFSPFSFVFLFFFFLLCYIILFYS